MKQVIICLTPMTSMCNPGVICSEKLDIIVTERVSKKNIWDDFDHRYRRNWSYAFPYNLWSLYLDDFKVLLHYSHLHSNWYTLFCICFSITAASTLQYFQTIVIIHRFSLLTCKTVGWTIFSCLLIETLSYTKNIIGCKGLNLRG